MGRKKNRAYLSEEMYRTVLLSKYKQYELASMIGVSPSAFNKAIHGHPINRMDLRWRELARIVKLPPGQLFG